MPMFNVYVSVNRKYIAEIEADSEEDAREIAENMTPGDLEEDGYMDTEISVEDIDEIEEDDDDLCNCGHKVNSRACDESDHED